MRAAHTQTSMLQQTQGSHMCGDVCANVYTDMCVDVCVVCHVDNKNKDKSKAGTLACVQI